MRRLMPKWEGACEGYARNFISRNLWRVKEQLGDYADAMQECRLIFHLCRVKYGGKVTLGHFKALYATSLHNAWNKYSMKATNARLAKENYKPEQDFYAGFEEFAVKVGEASPELQHALGVLATASTEILQYVFHYGPAKQVNRRIKEVTGFRRKSRRNLLKELKDLCTQ